MRKRSWLRPFLCRRIQKRARTGIHEVGFVSVDAKPCAAAPRHGNPATRQTGSRACIPGLQANWWCHQQPGPGPTQRIQAPVMARHVVDVRVPRLDGVVRRSASASRIRCARELHRVLRATTFESVPRLLSQRIQACFGVIGQNVCLRGCHSVAFG